MTFEVTFDDKEGAIVENYMRATGLTISEIVQRAILERIFDDDADLYAYEVARDKYKKNPCAETLAELKKHFGKGENAFDV